MAHAVAVLCRTPSLTQIQDRLLEIERHLELYANSPNPQRPMARAVTELLDVVRSIAEATLPAEQDG